MAVDAWLILYPAKDTVDHNARHTAAPPASKGSKGEKLAEHKGADTAKGGEARGRWDFPKPNRRVSARAGGTG